MSLHHRQNNPHDDPRGMLLALAAYAIWGAFPLFFHLLQAVNAVEIVIHRALWSLPTVALLLWLAGGRTAIAQALAPLRDLRQARVLALSALLLLVNWGFFVWGVNNGHTLQAALGYYINPLVNVLLGFLLLGERFTRAQTLALLLAAAAVLWLTLAADAFPWLALLLAFSFATYGYLRKTMRADALQGLFVETLLMLPPALLALWLLSRAGQQTAFAVSAWLAFLLVMAGPLSTAALVLFAAGARRIRLSTLGIMQYVTPTMHFLIAVLVFGEPFDAHRLLAFVLIWLALFLYGRESWRMARAAAG